MKLIFSIAHPKHVHIFRNTIKHFQEKGIKCTLLVVEKDVVTSLLDSYGLKYSIVGKNRPGLFYKIFDGLCRLYKIFNEIKRLKPKLVVAQADPFFAVCVKLLRIEYIVLPDTETAFLSNRIAIPLSKNIIASNSYKKSFKGIIRIDSYLELTYLHPFVFKPAYDVNGFFGTEGLGKYIIIRFVSWEAHHDIGHHGISLENKFRAVKQFSKFGKVFISSEKELPLELEKFRINITPDKMHDILAKASLFFGESATMAAESAVLGTPAIFLDDKGRGYTDELEKRYDLLYNFTESTEDQIKAISKGVEILSCLNCSIEWQNKRKKMLDEKINYTAFLIWFIENYPESHQIMKENPGYQDKFR